MAPQIRQFGPYLRNVFFLLKVVIAGSGMALGEKDGQIPVS
jgi:hypothetical protein